MKNVYDWIIVGGGIAGISVAEILTREGKSVMLLEKNSSLASETSKEFHEWFHSGALHTLAPDNLLTLRYLLGSADDLFQYYGNFKSMNLIPSESGIEIKDNGWVNNNYITYKFKKHLWNPIWLGMVSRSTNIIDMIDSHDWLRRRAGSEYGSSKVKFKHWFSNINNQVTSRGAFFEKESPDFTMNSRVLINDLLSSSIENGLQVELNANVVKVNETTDNVKVQTLDDEYIGKDIVICSPDAISNLIGTPIKKGFAPIKILGAKLKGGSIEMNGDISSQFISALLLIAPKIENGIKIKIIGDIVSKPYILMTLKLMKYFQSIAQKIHKSQNLNFVQLGGHQSIIQK